MHAHTQSTATHICTHACTQHKHTWVPTQAHSTNTGEHTETHRAYAHIESTAARMRTQHTHTEQIHTHVHTCTQHTHVHAHVHMGTHMCMHAHIQSTSTDVCTLSTLKLGVILLETFFLQQMGTWVGIWYCMSPVPHLCAPHCSTLTPAPVCPRHGLNLLSGVPLNTNIPSPPCQIVWPETCQNVLPACPRPIAHPESQVTFTPFLTFCLSRRSAPQPPRASRSVLLLL